MHRSQRLIAGHMQWVLATLLLFAGTICAHESVAPQLTDIGPTRGKTVQVTQTQIDLVLSALPDARKLDPEAKKRTQVEVREVLLQRAMLARGAVETELDKDTRVQLELRAAQQLVLANAYSRRLADPQRVTEKEIDMEYERAKLDLADIEYQMRRLSFVDEAKAQEAAKALRDKTEFEVVKQKLAVLSPAENPGEWRWIASQRMPGPVLEEVKRLVQHPKATSQPIRFEGIWYLVQVQKQRQAALPVKSEIQDDIRNKLAESKTRTWLIERRRAEGLDTTINQRTTKVNK